VSEIRYDRLNDTHVIVAPERLQRPNSSNADTSGSSETTCPFCDGNESMTPKEIYAIRENDSLSNHAGWQTRVVPNLYKAVSIEAPHQHHNGTFEYWDGFGAHEVIIDTPVHHLSMTQWNQYEMLSWLKTLRQRVDDLRRDHRITFISLFKNEGYDAGSTQSHCHTQLIGLPLVPKSQRDFHRRSREYMHDHNRSMMESIISDEEDAGVRMIDKHGDFSAFCPFASSYPFEVMIGSKKCIGQIDTVSDEHLDELASLLVSVLQKLSLQLNKFAFNLWVSTPPLGDESRSCDAHRLIVRIMPRLYRIGGFEINTEMMINPVEPEMAAKLLRGDDHD
jgi:UDPglucose--hexose-1-phosphate uridylyltransferase